MDIKQFKEKLINKYAQDSKHSNYQALPKSLLRIIDPKEVSVKTRYEVERLSYILSKISVAGKTVLDIGGNTGYFTFELAEEGATHVHYYEGNKAHAEFVKLAAGFLGLNEQIQVTDDYFTFEDDHGAYDIACLLNVLHHIGDDYGDKNTSIKEAKKSMIRQLNSLSDNVGLLAFQLGFNWQGNVERCLFENGTKAEMIDFIKEGVRGFWEISHIGVAVKRNGCVEYLDLDEGNIERNDALGEFLNRPLFILTSPKAVPRDRAAKLHTSVENCDSLKAMQTEFDAKQERKFLSTLVPNYKDDTPYSEIKKDIIRAMVASHTGDEKDKKVLQLGCANGYETALLSRTFLTVDCVDGAKEFIERLTKNNHLKNVAFFHSLFEEYELDPSVRRYDYVLCNYVLEHVKNPVLVLRQIAKSLSEQGLLFATVPNSLAFSRQLAKNMGLLEDVSGLTANDIAHGHRRVYDLRAIRQDFQSAGLAIISEQGVIFKILADFQLNKLLEDKVLTKKHMLGLQEMAMVLPEFCDSIFLVARKA